MAGGGGFVASLDRFQQRHPVVGFPLAVVYKFFDDQGAYLAALVAYYGFLSIFPLLLLLTSVLGFVLGGNDTLRDQIQDSAFNQIPILSQTIGGTDISQGLQGSVPAVVIGFLVALYGSIGVAQAAQNAMNRAWGVPRNSRPNPFKARGKSLLLVTVVGGGVVVTTALSTLIANTGNFGFALGTTLTVVAYLVTIGGNFLIFWEGFRLSTARDLKYRQLWPGALSAAVGWWVIQRAGTYLAQQQLAGANTAYGVFGVVLGLLGFLFVGSILFVMSAELNVVRDRRLYPRSLLTPFTDDVVLTPADQRAYGSYPAIERLKGFEQVHVQFAPEHTSDTLPVLRPDGLGHSPEAPPTRPRAPQVEGPAQPAP
ncbi:YihY/virulence factor BrkB family protein [Jatrophihabitans sp. YIM 134969]